MPARVCVCVCGGGMVVGVEDRGTDPAVGEWVGVGLQQLCIRACVP